MRRLKLIFLTLVSLLHGSAAFKCNSRPSPNCDCFWDPIGARFDISCTKKGQQESIFSIVYIPLTYLELHCNRGEWQDSNYEYLSELKFDKIVDKVKFQQCSPPKTSFVKICKLMGVEQFSSLIYNSWMSLEANFSTKLFEGMNFVTKLELDANNFTVLPMDLLENMRNLTGINLMGNRLDLKPDFFHHTPDLRFIELGNNAITTLPEGIFTSLTNLRHLNLQQNRLESITDEFANLHHLRILDLSFNRLRSIDKNAFKGLHGLTNLSLSFNSIIQLPDDLFANVQNLTGLSLVRNTGLKNLPKIFLQNLTKLEKLDLEACSIEALEPDAFLNLTTLSILELKGNKLKELPIGLFRTTNKLSFIDLTGNQLTRLDDGIFEGLTALKILNLSRNKLHTIGMEVFKSTPQLEGLDLSYNSLTFSNDESFSEYFEYDNPVDQTLDPLVRNLRFLNVSHNRIEIIPNGWRNIMKLEWLDASYNNITRIVFNDLIFFSSPNSTMELDISHNQIGTLNFQSAIESKTNRKDKIVVRIAGNPLNCDCAMLDVIKYIKQEFVNFTYVLDIRTEGALCAKPIEVPLLEVNRYSLVCKIPNENCIADCSCLVRPVDRTLVVNCEGANITTLPTKLPEVASFPKIELNLSGNMIQDVENVEVYQHVKCLNLSGNNLKSFPVTKLPPNLEVLVLENNNLEVLEEKSLAAIMHAMNTSGLNVTLSGNPWNCHCDSKHLLELQLSFQNILDISEVRCTNLEDNPQLIRLTADEFCPSSQTLVVGLSMAAVIVILIISALMVFYFKNQKAVKAWFYSKGWFLSWVSQEEIDKDKVYDAFLSFANEDEDFVVRELLPKLENVEPYYKLCIHTRDWPAGEFITDNIYDSVRNSRRTIILLTKNYLNSSWCLSEFQTAYQHAIEENTRRLILIVVGELPPLNHLPKDLRTYISTNTYLRSDDQWFWNKLRYAMPHGNKLQKSKPKPKRFDFNLKQKTDSEKESGWSTLELTPTQSPMITTPKVQTRHENAPTTDSAAVIV